MRTIVRASGVTCAMMGLWLMGCGSNPIGRMFESEGIAPPAAATAAEEPKPGTKVSVQRDGYPVDEDAPVAVPNLAGKWTATWSDPLHIQQDGERLWGEYPRNGRFDCVWNKKSRFNCTWRSDSGEGLAQIWQGARWARGHYAFSNDPNTWIDLKIGPYVTGRSSSPSDSGSSGSCTYNQSCQEVNTMCLDGRCVPSVGNKCSTSSDCGFNRKHMECVRGICTGR